LEFLEISMKSFKLLRELRREGKEGNGGRRKKGRKWAGGSEKSHKNSFVWQEGLRLPFLEGTCLHN
jgi:hypothetical protein